MPSSRALARARPMLTVLSLAGAGCEGDVDRLYRCQETKPALDVAAVSVLEDAASIAEMHDALVVDVAAPDQPAGTVRKLAAVEVLVALPESLYDAFPDGAPLTVEVFGRATPEGTPVSVAQRFEKARLSWEAVTIASGQSTHEQVHRTAWWRFELPNGGLTLDSDQVVAGVSWPALSAEATLYFGSSAGLPIGYSNYDRPCADNWSVYPDWRVAGSNVPAWTWVSNGATAETQAQGPNACSWPMLRVELRTERLSTTACD